MSRQGVSLPVASGGADPDLTYARQNGLRPSLSAMSADKPMSFNMRSSSVISR